MLKDIVARLYAEGDDLAAEAAEEIERLRAVVTRLPQTADGVHVVPDIRVSQVWRPLSGGMVQENVAWADGDPIFRIAGAAVRPGDGNPQGNVLVVCRLCFSTRELAEATSKAVAAELQEVEESS